MGGRGVGKTEVGAHYLLQYGQPGDPLLVVSPDYNVIQDTTWPTFQRVAEQTGQWIRGIKSPSPRAWFRPLGGGEPCLVVFKSAENPDKLRGGNWAMIWFDEASIMAHEAFTYTIPALRWRGRDGTCLVTMTPKGKLHWTFSLFFLPANAEECEILNGPDADLLLDNRERYQEIGGKWYRLRDGTGLVQAHSRENPFLPPTYEHDIGMHLSSALKEQELAGQFIELGGQYFKRHWFEIVKETPRIATRVRYFDRASTAGAGCYSAGVLMARASNGVFYVEDVVRGQWGYEERNAVIIDTARQDDREYEGTVQIWGEQEGGSAGKEVSQQFVKMLAGFPVHIDIVTGKGTKVLAGVEVPHKPKLIRAQGLIAQAEAGNVKIKEGDWNEDFLQELAAFGTSEIMDQCVAAGTMIATARGAVPIEQMQPTDFVWTRRGLCPIIQWGCTNDHATVTRIELTDGRSLVATPNHPIWTQERGWTWLGQLDETATLLTRCEKPSRSMALSGGDTRMRRSGTIGYISAATSGDASNYYTDTFGDGNTAKFPRTAKSTTSTRTRSTTPWTTWSVSPKRSTDEFTPTAELSVLPSNWPTWNESETRPRRGTRPTRGMNGTVNTESRWPKSESQWSTFATTAGKCFGESNAPLGHTVAINAENWSEDRDRLTKKRASCAESHLLLFGRRGDFALSPARIRTIGPSVRQPVYNLTVNGPPEYFANGILVHNCDAASGAFNKLCRAWTTDPGHTYRIEPVVDGERFGVHLDKSGGRGGRRRV